MYSWIFSASCSTANGYGIISAIKNIIAGEDRESKEQETLDALLEAGAKRVAAIFKTQDLAQKVEQAIHDMFSEHLGPAFEWFATVSERFVALCALGLEPNSAEEVRRILRNHHLILDSDVILNILCEGEPAHRATRELVAGWLRLGGTISLFATVLEEVAHHAWISENDFTETEKFIGRLDATGRQRYINNAFVRAYHTLEKTPAKWKFYITQFKGRDANDYGKILKSLRGQVMAELLPDFSQPELRREITEYLLVLAGRTENVKPAMLDKRYVGKAQRDGRVLASVAEFRVQQARIGSELTVSLVSSSNRLRKADNKFRSYIGEPPAVLSIASVSYLLALVPESMLGIGTLRQTLFEFGERGHLRDEQRIALRIIKATNEYDVPWVTRGILEQKLGEAIHREASKRGVPDDQIRRTFNEPVDPEIPAQLILESLTAMAADSRTTEQLYDARQKIEKLEEEKRQLETRLVQTFQEMADLRKKQKA